MRSRPARRSRLGNLSDTTQVFLPIVIRDTLGNPVVNKTFWLDRKRAPGGSTIPEYSGKYTTDDSGSITNTFPWDGSVPVTATISITPLFASQDAPANKAIIWQQPAVWYGADKPIMPIVVVLKPGGKIDLPTPTAVPAPPAPGAAPDSSQGGQKASGSTEEIDYWAYAGWGALGLAVLAVTYFYVLPAIFGKEGDK